MYENRIFKRDAFIKVTRRRFRDKRSETRVSYTNPAGNTSIKVVVMYPTSLASCSTLYVDDLELLKEESFDNYNNFLPGVVFYNPNNWRSSNSLTSAAINANALRITNNTVQEGFKRNITLAAKKYTFSFYMDKGLEDLNDKEYFSVDIINSSNAIVYTYTTKVNATGYYNFDYSATTAATYTWRFRRVSLNGRSTSGIAYFDDFKVSYNTQQSQQVCSSPKNYRFGFNGKEKESDMYGESNAYDFGARIHDARIGRWLSVDPMESEMPELSPYNFSSNSPISKLDPDGKWDISVHAYNDRKKSGYALMVVTNNDGVEVYRTVVKTIGTGGSKRDVKYANTPQGNYKILNWRSTGVGTKYKRLSFGPNKFLALDYQGGEGGSRDGMHIHGGRQEGRNKGRKDLSNTHGCMRINDADIKELKEITDNLEKKDPTEKGRNLTLKDDLKTPVKYDENRKDAGITQFPKTEEENIFSNDYFKPIEIVKPVDNTYVKPNLRLNEKATNK